ncbi:hypothetical protein GCM10007424_10760 [Flavobacterium suaedae]|uniref:DUF4168 domain-containing protein n=1 Tax=Flavobacterium suaedae TaxID=1767027 RepID=A0ABQ1JN93_9FLAO|nr:hypothetical protein [Flavobacterium suaedae]GGB72654.1 hypothetical protein GCM10007424_10760 [Flavobacterium suaedae]
MKLSVKLFVLFIFLSGTTTAFAQYYNQGATGGVNRNIAQQRYKGNNNKKRAENIDIVEVTVNSLAKELNLDDFQKAAVKVIYNDNKDAIMSIATEDSPRKAKEDKAREISEKIDKEIFKLLSEEQAKKYQEIIDKRKY